MKNLEKQNGFIESKVNKKTNEKIPFFNLGPKNDGKNFRS
jgi:hypothetical protein